MSYGFDKLHTVHPYGAMALQIPQRWTCKELTDGTNRWVCDEDKDEDWTASFWICLELFVNPPGHREISKQDQRDIISGMVGDRPPGKDTTVNLRVDDTDNEMFWTFEDTEMEDGDLLRFYWHRRAIYTPRGTMLLLTNLVILDDNKDDPEFQALAAFIENQVRTVAVTPPEPLVEDMGFSEAAAAAKKTYLFHAFDMFVVELPNTFEILDVDTQTMRVAAGYPDDDPPMRLMIDAQGSSFFATAAEAEEAVRSRRSDWDRGGDIMEVTNGAVLSGAEFIDPQGDDGWRALRCFRQHWHYVGSHDGQLVDVRFHLDTPISDRSKNLTRSIAHTLNARVPEIRITPPAKDPEWQSAELETRIANIRNGPMIHVPVGWSMHSEDDNVWWAEAPGGGADLKVQVEAWTPDRPLSSPQDISAKLDHLEGQMRGFLKNLKPVEPIAVEDVWGGRLVHAITDFPNEGEDWRCFRHYVCLALESRYSVFRFILSMRKDLAPTPLGRALIDYVGRETRDVRIADDAWSAAPLSEWRDVALDNRVFFRVPVLMDVRDYEGGKPGEPDDGSYKRTWYAWFRKDEITASMFISVCARTFLKDEDGDLVDLSSDPGIYEDIIAPWVNDGAVDRVAHGWLKYERFDDTEDRGDDADPNEWRSMPLRNDHWNYMTPIPGRFLDVDWLLLTPYESEDADVLALIEQIEQAVRAARFTRP